MTTLRPIAYVSLALAFVHVALGTAQVTMVLTSCSSVATLPMLVVAVVAMALWVVTFVGTCCSVSNVTNDAFGFIFGAVAIFNMIIFFGLHACVARDYNAQIQFPTLVFAYMHIVSMGFGVVLGLTTLTRWRDLETPVKASVLMRELGLA